MSLFMVYMSRIWGLQLLGWTRMQRLLRPYGRTETTAFAFDDVCALRLVSATFDDHPWAEQGVAWRGASNAAHVRVGSQTTICIGHTESS